MALLVVLWRTTTNIPTTSPKEIEGTGGGWIEYENLCSETGMLRRGLLVLLLLQSLYVVTAEQPQPTQQHSDLSASTTSFDDFQSLLKPEFWHSTLHSWSSFSKLFEAAKSNFECGKIYVLEAYDKNVPQEIKKIDWSEIWSAIAVAFVQTWEAVKRWWMVALLISEPCMVIGKICLDAMLPHLQTAVVVGWELFLWQLKENPHLVAACFLCMLVLYAIWRFGVLGRVHRRYQEIKRAIGQHTAFICADDVKSRFLFLHFLYPRSKVPAFYS